MNISTTSVNWTWYSTSTRWDQGEDEEEGADGGPEAHSHPGASTGVCFLVLGIRTPQPPRGPPTAHPRVSPCTSFPQVYTVVDEMFLAGEIRETSQTKVLKQLLMLQSLE